MTTSSPVAAHRDTPHHDTPHHDTLGEHLYDAKLRITRIVEFGASLGEVVRGERPCPPAGLRADVQFEGRIAGRVSGWIHGTDHLRIRPDGRGELDIRAVVVADDGAHIALRAGGVALPRPGSTVSEIREHAELTTAAPSYEWLNQLEVWACGEVDLAAGTIVVRGYAASTG